MSKMQNLVTILLLVTLLTGSAPAALAQVPPTAALAAGPLPAPAPYTAQAATPADALAPAADFPADVAIAWFKLFVQLTRRSPGFSPPVAARAFGYAGITLYEAMVAGMPGYQSLDGQLSDMPAMPEPPAGAQLYWPAVANAALATIARALFPTINDAPLRLINKLEVKIDGAYNAALGAESESLAQSRAYGRSVGEAVYAWSQGDGGHEGYMRNVVADYRQPTGEGLWQPTSPDYAPPLQPDWGQNRPMAPVGEATCAAPPPPAFSAEPDSAFYAEAREVYDTVRAITPEQEEIALFWSDDAGATATPPGHSLSIATQLLEQEEASLAQAALLYAKLGIALNDAFITCWQTKYTYNVMRPITFIQTYIDPDWNLPDPTDPVRTPNFPEYTSGHSVASRAAAEILTATFGDSYRFTDITHVDRGIAPRTFSSFYAASNEAAISRLYGGIHYRSAIEQGLEQGACVGKRVLALQFEAP